MLRRIPSFIVLALLACGTASLAPAVSWAALEKYVLKPDASFAWKLREKMDIPLGGRIYDLNFVSQTWQGARWEHQLQVYRPRDIAPGATLFLWVTGGSARPLQASLGMELARKSRAPVAFLFHIPNQPLLEEKLYEDDLIAETFVRYLETGDENWPLLFPMVKSVVKAMDVLQAFSKAQWSEAVETFIVSGASKRGWTSWLTAAVDRRVRAIAPTVIDVLNMREQMSRQLEAFGTYSAQLAPYTRRGLVPIPETPEGLRLLNMVDPWAYRERLTLPKLMINGTNDFYWATDALNLYWNQLRGDKWVVYVPNAGHNVLRREGAEPGSFSYLIDGLAAFARHQISGRPMPNLTWKQQRVDGRLRLTVQAAPAPAGARLWVARAPTQDFRRAVWQERAVSFSKDAIIGEVDPPREGYLAFFAELDYEIDGVKYRLSTQLGIAGAPK